MTDKQPVDWTRVVIAMLTTAGYVLSAILASPDWKIAVVLIATLAFGLAFAAWVFYYNRKQDARINEAKDEADGAKAAHNECRDEVRTLRTALAMLAMDDRRRTTKAVMRLLLGDERWDEAMMSARASRGKK